MLKNKLFSVLIIVLVLVSLFGGVVSAFEIQTEYGRSSWEYNGRDIQDLDAEGEVYTFQLVDYDQSEVMKFNPYFQHTRYDDAKFIHQDSLNNNETNYIAHYDNPEDDYARVEKNNNALTDVESGISYSSSSSKPSKRSIISNAIGFDLEFSLEKNFAFVGNYEYQKIDFEIEERNISKYELGLKKGFQTDNFNFKFKSVIGNAEEKYTKQSFRLDIYPADKLTVFAKVSRRENFDTEVINKQENVSIGFSSRF